MDETEMQLEMEKLSLERERLAVEKARIENARERVSERERTLIEGSKVSVPLSFTVLLCLLCLAAGGIIGALFSSLSINARQERRIANIVKTLKATADVTNAVDEASAPEGVVNRLKQSFRGSVKRHDAYENVSLIVIQGE